MYACIEDADIMDMPYMILTEGRILEVNTLFKNLTGYTEKDILNRKLEDIWKVLLRITSDYSKVKQSHECSCYMFDVNRNAKEVTIGWFETPEARQEIYTFREKRNIIFEEKFPLLELVNSANDSGVILFSVPDFVLLKANKVQFDYFSSSYAPPEELLGLRMEDIIHSWYKSKSYDIFQNVVKSGKPVFHDEKLIEYPEVRRLYLRYTIAPVFEDGEVKYLVLIHTDVTAEVEKSKQMEEVIKLKDDFLYLMSHEFKTPLTVINAAVQSLEHIYNDQIPEKARVLVGKIKQNAYRQLRLVNNLLDITRINSGQIKLRKRNIDIVLLARVITESVAIYAQQKGVEIIFFSKLQKKMIGIDDEKFERILLNLLSNAIKYTPAGKKVFVELSTKLNNKKRMICIKVRDQGIGIPMEKQKLIFERFGQVDSLLTRQAEGSGIGLYLVKLMVNACQGEIFLESEEGKGSVFSLLLPSNIIKEAAGENEAWKISDSRLVQSLATEFSDIYL